MARILIVEDEYVINELVRRNLELAGHSCTPVYDGGAALTEMQSDKYDLVILDVMLPELDGFSLLEASRLAGTEESVSHKTTGASGRGASPPSGRGASPPTIFLTARDSLTDRVKGFSLGADDYIVKPFEMLELTARVEAVLRRTRKATNVFELDGVRVELDGRIIYRDGEIIDLTPKEYDLLEVLITNRNIALSRDKLLELVWEYDYEGDSRTVDVHIQRLRRKLGWEERVKTVYKLGYRLEARP